MVNWRSRKEGEKEDYYKLDVKDVGILNAGAKELAQLALCRNMLLHLLPPNAALPGMRQEKERDASSDFSSILYKGYIDYAPFENQYSLLLQAIQKSLCAS